MVFIALYQQQEAHSDLFLKAGPLPLTYLPFDTMQRRGWSPGQCLDHRCQRQEKLSPCPRSAWGAEGAELTAGKEKMWEEARGNQ